MSSLSFAVLLVLPEFVHAFGTVGTNEPCKLVEPASWTQIDFVEYSAARGEPQLPGGNVQFVR